MIDEKKKLTESEKPRGNLIINRIAFAIIILFMFSLLFFILIKNFNPNNDVNYILPSLSVVFFLFGFIGIIIPLQFYSFIYKIGVKMISRSNYGDMISRLNKKLGYKSIKRG